MKDDVELADLLGEAPPGAPDPAFRFDVFARLAGRARRRAALNRALNLIACFAAVGLIFPVAAAARLTLDAAQPMLMAAGALALAAAAALLTIEGPRGVLARSRAVLRGALLRA